MQVFGNLDLMEHVFRSFYDSLDPDISWSTEACLRLAMLVSKEFFVPARNILWRSIPGLSPVLRILCNYSGYSLPKLLESVEVTKNYVRTTARPLWRDVANSEPIIRLPFVSLRLR